MVNEGRKEEGRPRRLLSTHSRCFCRKCWGVLRKRPGMRTIHHAAHRNILHIFRSPNTLQMYDLQPCALSQVSMHDSRSVAMKTLRLIRPRAAFIMPSPSHSSLGGASAAVPQASDIFPRSDQQDVDVGGRSRRRSSSSNTTIPDEQGHSRFGDAVSFSAGSLMAGFSVYAALDCGQWKD